MAIANLPGQLTRDGKKRKRLGETRERQKATRIGGEKKVQTLDCTGREKRRPIHSIAHLEA